MIPDYLRDKDTKMSFGGRNEYMEEEKSCIAPDYQSLPDEKALSYRPDAEDPAVRGLQWYDHFIGYCSMPLPTLCPLHRRDGAPTRGSGGVAARGAMSK